VSWTHGASVSLAQLATADPNGQSRIRFELTPSAPLDATIVKTAPQLMQVWFEPLQTPNGVIAAGAPTSLSLVRGQLTFGATLVWLSTDVAPASKVLSAGGRLLIRLHCWNLIDANQRMFSSAPDALQPGIPTLHLAGGVLESWLFIKSG
jgi:hypothetical protein